MLTLLVEASGKRLNMRLDTVVGRALLGPVAGDDARFSSETQFCIRRDEARGWVISADPGAVNPTLLNGTALTGEPVALVAGHVISVGSRSKPGIEKLRMTVSFEYE